MGHSASLWMEQVIRPVLILQLTDSALQIGLVVATRMAPLLFFGLLAGVVADRFNKRRILMVCQSVTMSMHFLLSILVLSGVVQPWHVFVTAFVSGSAMAFNQPARASLVPRLVPERDLMNAISLNTAAMNVMRIAGGGLAGLLLIPFTVGSVYLLNGIVYVGVILTTYSISLPEEADLPSVRRSWFADLKEGLTYATQNRIPLYLVALALALFVFGLPYQSVFVPLLAIKVVGLGESGVGALVATTGVGALIGALTMASRGTLPRRGLMLMGFLAVFSTALILLSRTDSLALVVLLLAAAGSMSVSYMALTNTLILETTPRELQGRIMSLLSLDRGLVPLGAILGGVLASSLGPQDGLLLMAATCLALTAIVATLAGSLRGLR